MKTNSTLPSNLLLSLVIPTMDRQTLLAETLSTIAPQLSSKVELVVLDSSKDSKPVQEMVQKAGGRYSWTSPSNFDQAYIDVVDLARGEYVWLFGDDDLLKSKAIEEVLEILNSSRTLNKNPVDIFSAKDGLDEIIPLDLLIVNADVIGHDSSLILKKQWLTLPKTEYTSADRSEVVAKLGGLMSFMGSIIVRKAFWSKGVTAATDHIGKRMITMIVPLIIPAHRVIYIPSVLVSARYGHQSWQSTVSTLIGKTMTDVIWSLPDVAEYAKQACMCRPPSWHSLFLWRACGQTVGRLAYRRAQLIGIIPVPLMRWGCRILVRLLGKTGSMTGYTLGFNR